MKHIWIKITSAVLLCMMLFGLVGCGEDYYFYGEDMNEYAEWDAERFQDLTVSIADKYEVTEEDVDAAIREALFEARYYVSSGKVQTTGTIGDGDVVKLWYFGTVDKGEDGTEEIRDSASGSTYNNDPLSFTLGNDSIRIDALEEALMDMNISSYVAETQGTVKENMVYFFTYRAYNVKADGSETSGGSSGGVVRVPAADLDDIFATGFADQFAADVVGKSFDKETFFSITLDGDFGDGVTARRYSLRLLAQTEKELEITGTFADDGKKYAGMDVTAYVQLFGLIDYEIPALTAENVISLFKISDKEEDPVAAYRAQVREELEADDERVNAIQNAIWTELKNIVTIKELPAAKVRVMEKIFEDTIDGYYEAALDESNYDAFVQQYGEAAMQNRDAFAVALLNGNAGETADDIVEREAKEWVSEDVIVFSVVQFSGMTFADEEEVEAGVDELVEDVVSQSGYEEERLYDMYGGREYFVASYYRNIILAELYTTVKITYTTAEIM